MIQSRPLVYKFNQKLMTTSNVITDLTGIGKEKLQDFIKKQLDQNFINRHDFVKHTDFNQDESSNTFYYLTENGTAYLLNQFTGSSITEAKQILSDKFEKAKKIQLKKRNQKNHIETGILIKFPNDVKQHFATQRDGDFAIHQKSNYIHNQINQGIFHNDQNYAWFPLAGKYAYYTDEITDEIFKTELNERRLNPHHVKNIKEDTSMPENENMPLMNQHKVDQIRQAVQLANELEKTSLERSIQLMAIHQQVKIPTEVLNWLLASNVTDPEE